MSDFDARPKMRLLAAMAALALTIGAGACGDSDDGSDGESSAGQAAASDGGSTGASNAATAEEKEQITTMMRDVRERFNSMDGAGFCANLSAAGKQEIVTGIRKSPYASAIRSRSCAGIVSTYSKEVVGRMNNGYRPVDIKRITVSDDKATVVMKGGLAGRRSVVPFNVVREDGEWRVADPITAAENTIRVETGD